MEAQRATNNFQQKASDCLGAENEKPYDVGQEIIDMNKQFALIRDAFTMIEALQKLSKQRKGKPKFKSGGIVKKPDGEFTLNGIYIDEGEHFIK